MAGTARKTAKTATKTRKMSFSSQDFRFMSVSSGYPAMELALLPKRA